MSFHNAHIVCKSANPTEYHNSKIERGAPEFVVSSSMLRLFSQCPSRWKSGYESPESDSKKFGSLLDCRLLTPEQFTSRFSVKPQTYPDTKTGELKPFNSNSTWCKNWIDEQGEREIVSCAEISAVDAARNRMMGDETIREYFECTDKQVWVRAEWKDKATGLTIPVQALIDFVPLKNSAFRKSIGDLKTVRSAALVPFGRQVYQLGWHLQAAFYLDLYMAAVNPKHEESGEDRTDWIFILQENYAPYETGRRLLSQDFIEIGAATYRHALARYARSLKTGEWAGYDEPDNFTLVNAEPWMEFVALEDALEHHQAEQLNDDLYATA